MATASNTVDISPAVPLAAPRRLAKVPSAAATTSATDDRIDGSVPLRMPAILRLQQPKGGAAPKHNPRGPDGEERRKATTANGRPGHGKRRQRRYENAQLAGNPHLHRPSRADFSPGPYMKDLSTKFAPPPKSFSRSTYISSSPADSPSAASLAASAEAGHFGMSLRGLRRNLRMATGPRTQRGNGGRTEEVLEIMERELSEWLGMSGRIPEGFYHDSTTYAGTSLRQAVSRGKSLDPTPLDDVFLPPVETLPDLPTTSREDTVEVPTLTELARQPHTLVWLAPSSHHRFLLHCLARYYDLSSFSRPLSPLEPDVRVTHVLRPQLVRPRVQQASAGTRVSELHGLETPPGTDWSTAGATTTEGELTATDLDTPSATDDAYDSESVGSVAGGSQVDPAEWHAAPAHGATDDEAEAVYSSATDSDDHTSDGGVDSLASSFADLSTAVPSTPRGMATPAFVSIAHPSPNGSATPTPLARPVFAPSPLSLLGAATSATPRPADRGRTGRRSLPNANLNGYTSTESSPSRSPTRAAQAASRGTFVGTAAGEWKLPARRFVDWLYD
ncbi:hypothetical protein JCM10908_004823 [Rhodotorula pacifica]|uniref:uncharacterized protein n=1 Tax=Rhodotorula pacifica TaxID=1495444 RepID=UPI00317BFBC1